MAVGRYGVDRIQRELATEGFVQGGELTSVPRNPFARMVARIAPAQDSLSPVIRGIYQGFATLFAL